MADYRARKAAAAEYSEKFAKGADYLQYCLKTYYEKAGDGNGMHVTSMRRIYEFIEGALTEFRRCDKVVERTLDGLADAQEPAGRSPEPRRVPRSPDGGDGK